MLAVREAPMTDAEERIEFRATLEFVEQLEQSAKMMVISKSAYLRLAVIEKMARDGMPYKPGKNLKPEPKKK